MTAATREAMISVVRKPLFSLWPGEAEPGPSRTRHRPCSDLSVRVGVGSYDFARMITVPWCSTRL